MCTALSLTTIQNHHYLGRTMDFPDRDYPWHLSYLPMDYQWQTLPLRQTLTTNYAVLGGMRHLKNIFLIGDGINSAGLFAAELYFPGKQKYYPQPQKGKLNLSPQDFIGWLLGCHASVAEITSQLDQVALNAATWYDHDIVHPLHWLISDATGSYIIEPTSYHLKIQHLKLGVLTNSPTYQRHLQKLTDFLQLPASATNQEIIQCLRNYHGEFPQRRTPSARFIKASLKLWQSLPLNDDQAIAKIFQILNDVKMEPLSGHADYTHYIDAFDKEKQICYFRDLNNHIQLQQCLPTLMAHFDTPQVFLP